MERPLSPPKQILPQEDPPESSMEGTSSLPRDPLSRNEENPTVPQNLEPNGVVVPEPTSPLKEEKTIPRTDGSTLGDDTAIDDGATNVNSVVGELDVTNTTVYFDANSTLASDKQSSSDLLERIPSMYRLIDLVYETGSTGQGGLVEKVIIDQESLGRLLNKLMPGSFRSISSVNFKSLDAIDIKPKGVYGSRSELAKFLLDTRMIDVNIARLLSPSDDNVTPGNLRSGLYLVLHSGQGAEDLQSEKAYLVYWPEETTWCDDAEPSVQRNRVTFMRYLTQLSDQIIALVSKDQADAFVWESSCPGLEKSEEEDDDDDGRMFAFEVQKSEDHEENITASPGFKVEIPPQMFAHQTIELIGGETSVGILASSFEQAKTDDKRNEGFYNKLGLVNLLASKRHNISIGHLRDDVQLELLMNAGLRERYKDIFKTYDDECAAAEGERSQTRTKHERGINSQMQKEIPRIEQEVRDIWKSYSRNFEAYIPGKRPSSDTKIPLSEDAKSCFEAFADEYTNRPLARIECNNFQDLKARIALIWAAFEARKQSEEEQLEFIQRVLDEPLENLEDTQSNKKGLGERLKSLGTGIIDFAFGGKDFDEKEGARNFAGLDDLAFLRDLDQALEDYPALRGVRQTALNALGRYLLNKEKLFFEQQTPKVRASIVKLRTDQSREIIDSEFNTKKEELWGTLWGRVRQAMDLEPSAGENPYLFESMILSTQDEEDNPEACQLGYLVRTMHTSCNSAHTNYNFYPLKPRKVDIQRQSDDDFTPQPQVNWNEAVFTFKLGEGYSLEFIQPMRDKTLVVIASSDKVHIYMNEFSYIHHAISSGHHKCTFQRSRLGSRPLYAYDETTRALAICHGEQEPCLSWYLFDERFSILRACRTIPLLGWHVTSAMQSMCFVAGSTQVCLVDRSGFARILSLESEQFGYEFANIRTFDEILTNIESIPFSPAHAQLGPSFGHTFSTPDGSCLLVTAGASEDSTTELRAYHWASFGTATTGFCPARLPPKSTYRAMSFERHGRCYLVSLGQTKPYTLSSIALHVKQRSAKFDFKAQALQSKIHSQKTTNNCLIDSHMEVWLRFPVVPAVNRNTLSGSSRQPRSITFVSEGDFDGAISYFSKLVGTFERATQKPTDGKLLAITVRTSSGASLSSEHDTPSSRFFMGGYLAELICLIPIQLAFTQENNFVPLKDGVLNPSFERELLGADVPTIISSLSLGWYESLFQSYLATKPVRVVSSMGEQSVGKSYCLNHLADTSFAGSV